MSRLLAAIGRAVETMFPWPSRRQRHAAIAAARSQKEAALEGAADAASVQAAITRMAAENHFAAAIADQIIARHRREA